MFFYEGQVLFISGEFIYFLFIYDCLIGIVKNTQ